MRQLTSETTRNGFAVGVLRAAGVDKLGTTAMAADEQLKLLFDYTKFHIGLYVTLITAIIAVFSNETLKKGMQVIFLTCGGLSFAS